MAQKMNINARQSSTRPIPDVINQKSMARNGGSHVNRHQVLAVVRRELERYVLAQKGARGFNQQTTRAGASAMQRILDILEGRADSLPVEGEGAEAVEELQRDVA